jgi:hypothetical protein
VLSGTVCLLVRFCVASNTTQRQKNRTDYTVFKNLWRATSQFSRKPLSLRLHSRTVLVFSFGPSLFATPTWSPPRPHFSPSPLTNLLSLSCSFFCFCHFTFFVFIRNRLSCSSSVDLFSSSLRVFSIVGKHVAVV